MSEHDEMIIEKWNSVVKPEDDCYILGDLMLGADHDYGINCLHALNGRKHMVIGNHDAEKRLLEYAASGIEVLGHADILKAEGYKFFLCHYKAETSCIENMAKLKHHLISLHGHTHSPLIFESDKPYQYNVAIDAHGAFPVSVEEIVRDIDAKVQECLEFL